MKKIAFLLCLASGLAIGQTYTDSAGTSVRDKDGQGRDGRGTIGAGNAGGGDPLDPGDVEVPDGITNDQLQDMGVVEATATCEFPATTFTAIPCPDYTDGSCNFMGTPDLSAAGSRISAAGATSLSASQLFGTTTIQSDPYTVVIDLKSTTGYTIKANGQADSLGGAVSGDEFDGVSFNATRVATSVKALNKPVLIVPGEKEDKIKRESRTQRCTQNGYRDEICYQWWNPYVAPGEASYLSPSIPADMGLGIFNSFPAGQLNKIFMIRDFEHVVENGKYTRNLNIEAEVLVTAQGDSLSSFYGTNSASEPQIVFSKTYIMDGTTKTYMHPVHDMLAKEGQEITIPNYRLESLPLSPYNSPSTTVGGEPAIVTASCTFNGPESPVTDDWDTVPGHLRGYCENNNIPPEQCDCDLWYARGLECGI